MCYDTYTISMHCTRDNNNKKLSQRVDEMQSHRAPFIPKTHGLVALSSQR